MDALSPPHQQIIANLDEIRRLKKQIEGLKDSREEVPVSQVDIEGLDYRILQLEEKTQKLLTQLQEQKEETSKTVGVIESQSAQALQQQKDTLRVVSNYNRDMTSLREDLDSLKEQHQSEIDKLKKKDDELSKDVRDLNSRLLDIEEKIQELTGEIARLDRSIATKIQEVRQYITTSIKQSIDATVREELDSFQEQLSEFRVSINLFRNQMEQMKEEMKTVSTKEDIERLTLQLSEIEGKLDEKISREYLVEKLQEFSDVLNRQYRLKGLRELVQQLKTDYEEFIKKQNAQLELFKRQLEIIQEVQSRNKYLKYKVKYLSLKTKVSN